MASDVYLLSMDRPMLAAAYRKGVDLSFPLLATPKIDGVRALIVNGRLVSRSFKLIPNVGLRAALETMLPEGADGEVSCGSLYDTTSAVMSEHHVTKNITFSWFDWAYDLNAPYGERADAIREYTRNRNLKTKHVIVVPLVPNRIDDARDLERYEAAMLARGHEGVVVRAPHGRYKCGRSTLKEGLMIKIKREDDFEALIIGTEELMHNMNDAHSRQLRKRETRFVEETLGAGRHTWSHSSTGTSRWYVPRGNWVQRRRKGRAVGEPRRDRRAAGEVQVRGTGQPRTAEVPGVRGDEAS